MSETHKAEKTENPAHKTSKNNQLIVVAVVVVLLLVGLALVLMHSSKNKNNTSGGSSVTTTVTNGNAKLYIKPASQSVASGNSVTFEVWEDSGDLPVNAVQANLAYPADSFDFGSIDAKGSAFEVQAMATGGNGKVNIARGHIGNLKGENLVAKVTLTAKAQKGDAKVDFADGSAIVTSTDHKDILKVKTGTTYKVE